MLSLLLGDRLQLVFVLPLDFIHVRGILERRRRGGRGTLRLRLCLDKCHSETEETA